MTMAQYIDKAAVVAEIKMLKENANKRGAIGKVSTIVLCNELLSFIDTLEVKEVDLSAAVERYVEQHKSELQGYMDIRRIARHFFELGLKAQKVQNEIKIGETKIYLEDDGGEPPYNGKQWLDLSCMEYEIPEDKFKDGDNVEIIIRKTQKGE